MNLYNLYIGMYLSLKLSFSSWKCHIIISTPTALCLANVLPQAQTAVYLFIYLINVIMGLDYITSNTVR
jgi:hypothetical protein